LGGGGAAGAGVVATGLVAGGGNAGVALDASEVMVRSQVSVDRINVASAACSVAS
jgi:hypothetical protein